MSVKLTALPGGLRVVTDPVGSVETVSLGIWVHAGARNEAAAENGVSHLLEHMAFKGTERRSARAIAEEIEAVGGHLNAYTSREFTVYHATVLAGHEALALDIIADILQASRFDPAELARERAVVLQEIGEAEDTPDDIVFDRFQEAAFPDQPLGRPVLGTPKTVGKMTRAGLTGYLARHYAAPRMVMAAAGKLEPRAIKRLAEQAFDRLGAAAEIAPAPARYGGGERREERDLEQVHLTLGFRSVSYTDPDYYAVAVLSMLLGGGMSSRLFQEIREERGLAYSIYSFSSTYHDSGLFGVYAGTGRAEAEELATVLCAEIAKLRHGVAADEVARARTQLKAGILMSLESTAARCEQLARQLLVYGRPLPLEEVTARIDAVDEAAVVGAAERLLATPPSLAAVGPLDRLPGQADIATLLAGG